MSLQFFRKFRKAIVVLAIIITSLFWYKPQINFSFDLSFLDYLQETEVKTKPEINITNLTLKFVDQYEHQVHNYNYTIFLYDALGEKMPGKFKLKDGIAIFDRKIPPGKYTIVTRAWKSSGLSYSGNSVNRFYSESETSLQTPQNGNWYFQIKMNQEKIIYFQNLDITLSITNELGTPIDSHKYNEWSKVSLKNSKGQKVGINLLGRGEKRYRLDTIGHGLAPESYTLHIEHDGYKPTEINFNLPDVSATTDEQIISQKIGTIDLGTVLLEKTGKN